MINYKALIRNRNTRIRILQLFNWVPDKLMISVQYFIKTGRRIHWKNPRRFTEKLQLYKIQTKNNTLMSQCADKYDVRLFVEKRGLKDILVPLVTEDAIISTDEIEWDNLPCSFVLKDTLGSGGNSVIIVKDKSSTEKQIVIEQCKEWLYNNFKHGGREHIYDKNKHRIIIERLLDPTIESPLIDYKFFCFDGKPEYVYAISNRILGQDAEIGIYDIDFNLLPYRRLDERPSYNPISKPENYDSMVSIARILSEGFPEVRIDLYNIRGKIYFGEMTFFDGSGYMKFYPDEFDYILGENFNI